MYSPKPVTAALFQANDTTVSRHSTPAFSHDFQEVVAGLNLQALPWTLENHYFAAPGLFL